MKNFILVTSILIALVFANCAGPSNENIQRIPLKSQKLVITSYSVGKYTSVHFTTQIDIQGNLVTIAGDNGVSGYYYKEYSLNVGDTIVQDINLIFDCDKIIVENVNFKECEIKQ